MNTAMEELTRSSITGGLVSFPIGVLMARKGMPLIDLLTWVIVVFCVVTLSHWLLTLLMWYRETITNRDIDGDGYIGQPVIGAEIIHPVRIDVIRGNTTDRASFENAAKLAAVSDLIVSGVPFSQRELSGILSRLEFERMAEEMLARGLIEYRNPEHPRQGYSVTDNGAAMFADVASRPEGFV